MTTPPAARPSEGEAKLKECKASYGDGECNHPRCPVRCTTKACPLPWGGPRYRDAE